MRRVLFITWIVSDLESAEDLYQRRVTRILTNDFPVYFALVTRIRQETKLIGMEGGLISSTVVPQVQAMFPDGAIQKSIRVGVQVTEMSSKVISHIKIYRMSGTNNIGGVPRRQCSPTAVQAWQPCPLWEPSPSHHISM